MGTTKKISLGGIMDEFNSEITESNRIKQSRGGESDSKSRTKAKGKEKGSAWRLEERPVRKTIHFDNVLNQKINMLKTLIGNTSIEDIIYDATKEYVERMLQEKKEELGGLM